MSQSRLPYKNEVDLTTYLKDDKYYYFPIGHSVGKALKGWQQPENTKLINNGIRTFCSRLERRDKIFLITNEGDILGEIAAQETMTAVANYRYFSHEHNKTFTKKLAPLDPLKKKEKNQENNSSKKLKRKLTPETTTPTQSPQKPFSNNIDSPSTPRPTIASETKAPAVAQETKFVVPTDTAAIEQKIPIEAGPLDNLRKTMVALNKQAEVYKTSKNMLDLYKLQSLIKSAAYFVTVSYDAQEKQLKNLSELIMVKISSTLYSSLLFSIRTVVTQIQQIVKTGKTLVPQAIQLLNQDLQFYRNRNETEPQIQIIIENLKNLRDCFERLEQDPFYAAPPQSHAVPHGPLSTLPTVTPLTSTGLTTPTVAAPLIASPLSTASAISPSPARTYTSPWSGPAPLFSPPPQSPPAQHNFPLPLPPEGGVENGFAITEEMSMEDPLEIMARSIFSNSY